MNYKRSSLQKYKENSEDPKLLSFLSAHESFNIFIYQKLAMPSIFEISQINDTF